MGRSVVRTASSNEETPLGSGAGAVVVGGGHGYVGRSICQLLAPSHPTVCLDLHHRSANSWHCETVDLRSLEDTEVAMAQVKQRVGQITGIICCAGVMDSADTLFQYTLPDTLIETLKSNVVASINLIQASLPHMPTGGDCAIVIVGSLVAHRGSATPQLAYTASKGALSAICRDLAVSLAPLGIRVNEVAPGPLESGLFAPTTRCEQNESERVHAIPMGRRGRAQEVANVCAFLLSDQASYITGATIPVDGGASAAFIACDDKRNSDIE